MLLKESRGKLKELWTTLGNRMGKGQTSDGISFLEENGSQICDSAQILNNHVSPVSDMVKLLSDTNSSTVDPFTATAFVRKFKHSYFKLIFKPITPEETQKISESIPSNKTTGANEFECPATADSDWHQLRGLAILALRGALKCFAVLNVLGEDFMVFWREHDELFNRFAEEFKNFKSCPSGPFYFRFVLPDSLF